MRSSLLSIAILISCTGQAFASPEAEAHVGSIIDRLSHVEGSNQADFVIDQVDMSRLSKFVLGKYARSAKPEELTQFEYRLAAFLRDFLKPRSMELANATVEILSSVDRNDTDSIVTTRVSSPTRSPMLMRWRVLFRDGDWKVVDVEVHGLWLAIEQRAQISDIMNRDNAKILDLYPPEDEKSYSK
jgi:phospholipid transport system substrate-binding protein